MRDVDPIPPLEPANDAAASVRPGEVPSSESPSAAALSLMITRRQKEQLRAGGFSEAEIREMTPAEAHAHLGV